MNEIIDPQYRAAVLKPLSLNTIIEVTLCVVMSLALAPTLPIKIVFWSIGLLWIIVFFVILNRKIISPRTRPTWIARWEAQGRPRWFS